MSSLLRLRTATNKDFLKSISNWYISLSVGTETVNRFVHTRSSLENHTQFQTKMRKVYFRFQTKTAQKNKPFEAAHTYVSYIGELPSGHVTQQRGLLPFIEIII